MLIAEKGRAFRHPGERPTLVGVTARLERGGDADVDLTLAFRRDVEHATLAGDRKIDKGRVGNGRGGKVHGNEGLERAPLPGKQRDASLWQQVLGEPSTHLLLDVLVVVQAKQFPVIAMQRAGRGGIVFGFAIAGALTGGVAILPVPLLLGPFVSLGRLGEAFVTFDQVDHVAAFMRLVIEIKACLQVDVPYAITEV